MRLNSTLKPCLALTHVVKMIRYEDPVERNPAPLEFGKDGDKPLRVLVQHGQRRAARAAAGR
jgi:hypothetical protein